MRPALLISCVDGDGYVPFGVVFPLSSKPATYRSAIAEMPTDWKEVIKTAYERKYDGVEVTEVHETYLLYLDEDEGEEEYERNISMDFVEVFE